MLITASILSGVLDFSRFHGQDIHELLIIIMLQFSVQLFQFCINIIVINTVNCLIHADHINKADLHWYLNV